jgi:hypothetical protein
MQNVQFFIANAIAQQLWGITEVCSISGQK